MGPGVFGHGLEEAFVTLLEAKSWAGADRTLME